MNSADFGKELLGCISLDEKKLSKLVIEGVVLHALEKVVKDSDNIFDDQAFALIAPLIGPKIEEVLAEYLGKLGA
jgi:hypothetical protein